MGSSAIIARLTRASMLQVIREDYIRTARAKGLSERVVMVRHALKNAFIPVATVFGPMFAALVTGTFVVEQIFAIPGMGKYFHHQYHQPGLSRSDGHRAALCRVFGYWRTWWWISPTPCSIRVFGTREVMRIWQHKN
jgi:hypothetical protein